MLLLDLMALFLSLTRSATGTGGFFLAFKCRVDHGRGTADTAAYLDGSGRTIDPAGTAFHTIYIMDDHGFVFPHLKNMVGANHCAHCAAVAQITVEYQGIFLIRIEHHSSFTGQRRIRSGRLCRERREAPWGEYRRRFLCAPRFAT